MLQGQQPGGQLVTTVEVENYPGFPDGLLGPDLMARLEAQARRFGASLEYGTVTAADFGSRPFRLYVDDGRLVTADAVIIATGASAKYLGLPNERRLIGRGVSTCAMCDGVFFRGKDVAVVGGGDTAVEEALFLTRFATKVYVIHRRDRLRASQVLQDRLRSHPRVTIIREAEVADILGEREVEGLRLRRLRQADEVTLPVAALYVAIGHTPNTAAFRRRLTADAAGCLATAPGTTRTAVPGVFAGGDVQDPVYRQAVTAAGTGALAGFEAERFLAGLEAARHAAHAAPHSGAECAV